MEYNLMTSNDAQQFIHAKREQALTWWCGLWYCKREDLMETHLGITNRQPESLTGREIQEIFEKEHDLVNS